MLAVGRHWDALVDDAVQGVADQVVSPEELVMLGERLAAVSVDSLYAVSSLLPWFSKEPQ